MVLVALLLASRGGRERSDNSFKPTHGIYKEYLKSTTNLVKVSDSDYDIKN